MILATAKDLRVLLHFSLTYTCNNYLDCVHLHGAVRTYKRTDDSSKHAFNRGTLAGL